MRHPLLVVMVLAAALLTSWRYAVIASADRVRSEGREVTATVTEVSFAPAPRAQAQYVRYRMPDGTVSDRTQVDAAPEYQVGQAFPVYVLGDERVAAADRGDDEWFAYALAFDLAVLVGAVIVLLPTRRPAA